MKHHSDEIIDLPSYSRRRGRAQQPQQQQKHHHHHHTQPDGKMGGRVEIETHNAAERRAQRNADDKEVVCVDKLLL